MSTPQPPEGRLIEQAREDRGLAQNAAARAVGLSGTRWRQIVKGEGSLSGPKVTRTLARMAYTVGVTPSQLMQAGREDAARELDALLREVAASEARIPLVARPAEWVLSGVPPLREEETLERRTDGDAYMWTLHVGEGALGEGRYERYTTHHIGAPQSAPMEEVLGHLRAEYEEELRRRSKESESTDSR